ncbi:MAG: zinc-ribbon and DUF3426 domain-containing protein [Gammaproteobacteria bacterium]
MLTTCTACGTQFRVNTGQLRAVHGLVRCSRCHSVFDAFETLREEFEAATAAPETEMPDELNALAQEIIAAKNAEPAPISVDIPVPSPDTPDMDIQLKQETPTPPTDDLFADLWGVSPAATPAGSTPEPAAPLTPVLIEDHIPKPPDLARDQALYRHAQLPPRERRAPKMPRRPLAINAWGVGALLLALLLGAQVVNAHRVELSHNPILGPPLSGLYAILGHSLAPPPSLSTWQVSNINVTSDPDTPGALSITGDLQNNAGFAQTWPLLRVELTDRYGDPLRARDFTAGDYLPTNRTVSWLGSGMATRFRIDVVDPGPEAVGFQVQPCLDVTGGRQCSVHTAASE